MLFEAFFPCFLAYTSFSSLFLFGISDLIDKKIRLSYSFFFFDLMDEMHFPSRTHEKKVRTQFNIQCN